VMFGKRHIFYLVITVVAHCSGQNRVGHVGRRNGGVSLTRDLFGWQLFELLLSLIVRFQGGFACPDFSPPYS
jgi:hypothetical protein